MTADQFDVALSRFRIAVGQDCMPWFCAQYGVEPGHRDGIELILYVGEWLNNQKRMGS